MYVIIYVRMFESILIYVCMYTHVCMHASLLALMYNNVLLQAAMSIFYRPLSPLCFLSRNKINKYIFILHATGGAHGLNYLAKPAKSA